MPAQCLYSGSARLVLRVSLFLRLLVIPRCISWAESNYSVTLGVEQRVISVKSFVHYRMYVRTIDLVPAIMDDKKSHDPLSAGQRWD